MPDPRLEVHDAQGCRIVAVGSTPFLIGRRAGSDLLLSSGEISRDQAEIVSGSGGYILRDRGSRQGTFVNDASIRRADAGGR